MGSAGAAHWQQGGALSKKSDDKTLKEPESLLTSKTVAEGAKQSLVRHEIISPLQGWVKY